MQPPKEYTTEDPVETLEPAPPKEKRYQFCATARAWHSKYKRHLGKKQLAKEMSKEAKAMPDTILISRIEELTTIRSNPDLHPTVDLARLAIVITTLRSEFERRTGTPFTPNEVLNTPTA